MTRRQRGTAERLHRLLLLWYPRAFRLEHGEEMVRLALEREDEARSVAGEARLLVLRMRAVWDAMVNGMAERWDVHRRRREPPIRGGSGGRRGRGGGMEAVAKDLAYAVRTLLKSPGFAIVAVVTIALGIGANTAIFSVVRAVLLQPLPYEEPEELVLLWGEMRTRGVTHFPASPPDFLDFREGADALESLGAVFTFQAALTGDGDPVQVDIGNVTTNFFDVLGVEPMLGRSFIDEDGVPDDPNVTPGSPGALPGMAILSHALWQQRYGGDRDVIGRGVEIGGASAEIVGVMPPGFELLMPATAALTPDVDLWLAARIDFLNAPRNNVFLRPVGRLRDGATPAQLQAQLDRVVVELSRDDEVKTTAGFAVRVEELHADLTAEVRPILLALFGAVGFVLLIACANVSNLLLVRASSRDRELAVRAAMGGSRARLVRQMLIESGLLAAIGAALGVVLAFAGVAGLLALRPENLPRLETVRIDGAVLGFTVLSAAFAALLFGAVPALQTSRVDLVDALKERGQAGATAGRKLIRNGVVIVEVALSLVLLIGAGLMVRSFAELAAVDPGYDTENVLTFEVAAPFGRYPQASDRADFKREVQRRLESIPGVERAAAGFPLPLSGQLFNGRYGGEEALTDPEAFGQAAYRSVTPGYFDAMDTQLLEGRALTEADDEGELRFVVVDEPLARSLWPGESAVGRRFLIRAVTPEPQWVEVVGVVEHQRAQELAREGMPTVYFPETALGAFGGSWVLEAGVDPLTLVSAIRAEIAAVDPDVPVAEIALMESFVDRAMAPTRFALTSISVFSAIALLLAVVGLYGVLSFTVRQRTAEIGVRVAFGAERGSILKLVVGQGLTLAVAGVFAGLLVAWPVTRVLESLLVGVEPTDPLTYLGISGLFVAVAALACWLPARRATRVDPVSALRE